MTWDFCIVVLAVALLGTTARAEPAADADALPPTHEQRMSEMGLIRHAGAWRTAQEIELAERAAQGAKAERDWTARLERLRRQLERSETADRATVEIREIADPFAVPALSAALAVEPAPRVRALYVEALSHVRSPGAYATLTAVAFDHPDRETRHAAVDRLVVIGPHAALPRLTAALGSSDNLQVNRAAEALGWLGVPSAVAALIAALETEHVMVRGEGPPAGSTSATFTPTGGGLAMGSGPKPTKVRVRNPQVLEALVALTGTNFEWDQAAWRSWLANRESPPPGYDPRRG
jgi:hypothetical protein